MFLRYRLLYTILIGSLLIIITGVQACKLKDNKTENTTGFNQVSDTTLLNNDAFLKSEFYNFPSAKEMFVFIEQENELNYKAGITNPASNYQQYIDTKSKTLNLGVYLADLTYMTLYNRTSYIYDYFEVVQFLSKDLRINIPFSNESLMQIKNNLSNTDSVIFYSERHSNAFYDYMVVNNKNHTLGVISTGSYIEGLYIILTMIDNYADYPEVVQRIADQKYTFENLYLNLQEFKHDPNAKAAIVYVQKILDVYDKLEVQKQQTTLTRDKNKHMVIEGGEKIVFTEKSFVEFKSLIKTLRNNIITNI